MRSDIDIVLQRQRIGDVLLDYVYGVDNLDRESIAGCWHEGGTVSHDTLYTGTAAGFLPLIVERLGKAVTRRHTLANIRIVFDADGASVESYFTAVLRFEENGTFKDIVRAGRYKDRFECRNDRWAIVHRETKIDWSQTLTVNPDRAEEARYLSAKPR